MGNEGVGIGESLLQSFASRASAELPYQQTADGRNYSTQYGRHSEEQHGSCAARAADSPTTKEIGRAAKRPRPCCSPTFLPYCELSFLPSAVCRCTSSPPAPSYAAATGLRRVTSNPTPIEKIVMAMICAVVSPTVSASSLARKNSTMKRSIPATTQ